MSLFKKSLKITLQNNLKEKTVKVIEENIGIRRVLTTLAPKEIYSLKHDLNATYRQYILIMLPGKAELRVLSLDDVFDWREISMYENGDTYDWMGTVRRSKSEAGSPAANNNGDDNHHLPSETAAPTASGRGKVASFFQKMSMGLYK